MDSTYPHSHERKHREEQKEATIRSIDETRDNVRRAIEEAKRETPRFAQTITDFQNETADATKEITDTFLETQKNVVISIQSAWADVADRTGYWAGWMQPWNYFWWPPGGAMVSPTAMADMYARMLTYMTMNFAAATRIATSMMFAGLETARASTRYAKDSSREISRMISINVQEINRMTRESVVVRGEAASSTSAAGPTATTREEEGQVRGETGGTTIRRK
jgi:gas vesicle protein